MITPHTIAGAICGAGLVTLFTGNTFAGIVGMTGTLLIYSGIDLYNKLTRKEGLDLNKE